MGKIECHEIHTYQEKKSWNVQIPQGAVLVFAWTYLS